MTAEATAGTRTKTTVRAGPPHSPQLSQTKEEMSTRLEIRPKRDETAAYWKDPVPSRTRSAWVPTPVPGRARRSPSRRSSTARSPGWRSSAPGVKAIQLAPSRELWPTAQADRFSERAEPLQWSPKGRRTGGGLPRNARTNCRPTAATRHCRPGNHPPSAPATARPPKPPRSPAEG